MPKVVARNCPHCGAALQVDPQGQLSYNVTCSYCKTVVTIVPFAARQPTAIGIPQFPAGPNVILLDAKAGAAATTAAKTTGCIIVLSVALPFVIALFAAVGGPCASYANSRFSPWLFPIECSVGEEVVIRDRKETLTEPFVKGTNSCKVRIVNSQLTGPFIVKGGGNVTVTVENSVLRVTKAVMEGDGNSTLELTEGSKVYTDGIVASGNYHVTVELTGSSIESKGGVVKATNGAKVRAKEKSRVSAAKPVIEGIHGEVTLDDSELVVGSSIVRDGTSHFKISASNQSTIRSDGVAVAGGTHGLLELSASKLTGKDGAVDVGMHNKVTLSDGATINSPQDALRMGTHCTVEVGQGAKIESGKTAIRVGTHSNVQVNGGTVAGANSITADDYTTVKLRRATIRGARNITGRYSNVQEE